MIRLNQREETIVALATAPGASGIAIVRLSGKESLALADKFFSKKVSSLASHTVHFGSIFDKEGKSIDSVLLLMMKGPRSFTGEDTVEIHCHGGSVAPRKVLERALEVGARMANPGEFTYRAFLNGKMDLTQAEAVAGLIHAKNERAFRSQKELFEGRLSKKISSFNRRLTEVAAIIEAWVDFPEEGLEFASQKELEGELSSLIHEIRNLLNTFHEGKKIREGVTLCIAGAPNVGKSSLMNALLDQARAIVTEIPGTTRDLIEEEMRVNGLTYHLIDTAGIRDTEDRVEKEGILRAKEALNRADLLLLVLDATKGIGKEEKELFELAPLSRSLAIWNKIDLKSDLVTQTVLQMPAVFISAKENIGIKELKEKIEELTWKKGVAPEEELILTHERHYETLMRAELALELSLKSLIQGLSPELISFELKRALIELSTLLGLDVNEEILSSIFSKFCIGK